MTQDSTNVTTDSKESYTVVDATATVASERIRSSSSSNSNSNINNNALKTVTTLLAESITWGKNDDHNSYSAIPRGCQFSPDGTCLLTSRANRLELYNTPYDNDDQQDDDDDGNNNEDKAHKNDWEPVITCNSGESVRSYAWYPHMKSSDPASCCFLGVSRDSPVHLYDAYDGSIRATYRPYNALDEMESPTTLCFVENGQKIVTGGLRSDRILHVFDINRPGREHSRPMLKLGKTRRSKDGQKGLVSAMAYSERTGVIAVGTYSPGSIYLYDLRTYSRSPVAEIVMSSSTSTSSGGSVCVVGHGKRGKKMNKRKRFAAVDDNDDDAAPTDNNRNSNDKDNGGVGVNDPPPSSVPLPSMNFSAAKLQWYQSRTRGGVTQVEFDDDDCNGNGNGHYLFSTSRRSNAILQWDLRKISSSNFCPGIASFETDNDTNQRIEFQIHGDQIWTGGRDGCVRVYNHRRSTAGKSHLLAKIDGFRDCVNGISLHFDIDVSSYSNNPTQLQRLFSSNTEDDDDDDNDNGDDEDCNNSSIGLGNASKSLLAVSIGTRHFPSDNDWENEDPHTSLTNRTNRFVGSTQVYSCGGL